MSLQRKGVASRFALASAVVTLLAMLMMTGVAGAQVELPWDHYLCYPAKDTHKQKPPPVILIDQFDEFEKTQENVKPGTTDRLCAPVFEKNHKRVLFDEKIHLKRYPFKAQPKEHTAQVFNQFEEPTLKTTGAAELMVPTSKSVQPPPPSPPTGEEYSYEHYKCYKLAKTPPFTAKAVTVVDQFGSHVFKVVSRLWLCNPTTKIVKGTVFKIHQPERHLVCYGLKPVAEPARTVFTNNQFFPEELKLSPANELCLPSLKHLIKAKAPRS